MCCDYVANLFQDWVRQNVAHENRLALVYRCATRSTLWANNKSVKRCNIGFGKSWRRNRPHVYTVLIKKPDRAEHSFTMRFDNPRHARQHFLQRRACENHSQYFENILTGEVFRQCAIQIGRADRLVGTMFCGRHPRIIVQAAIPSLLGTYADASQAFEWLNRAYAQRDGGLVDIKVDPLLRSLHGDPRYAALLEEMRLPL